MKKNIGVVMLVLSLFVAVIAGCSGGKDPSSQGSSPSGERKDASSKDIELNVTMTVTFQGDQDEPDLWNEIIRKYMDQNPGVKINFNMETLSPNDHRTWITTQLVGGIAPDVFTHRYVWDQEDLQKGLIKDLTPMFQENNPYAEDKKIADMFSETLLSQLGGATRKYASVPTTLDVVRIIYNKDLFQQAGIGKTPETWNAFMDAQAKLAAIGVIPFGFPNSKQGDANYTWSVRMLTEQLLVDRYGEFDANKNGTIQLNEYVKAVDEGKIDITQAPYNEVYPFMKDWSQYWTKGFNGLDNQSVTDMFLRGDVAMVMKLGRDAKKIYQSDAKAFETGAFPFPYLTKENSPNSGNKLMEIGGVPSGVLAIPERIDEDKFEAAKDFIKFIISPEIQGLLAERLYQTPSITGADMPENLKEFEFSGQRMLLNLYGGELDKNVTDQHHRFGQLFLGDQLTQEKYLAQIQGEIKLGVEQHMRNNQWSKENHYGIQ